MSTQKPNTCEVLLQKLQQKKIAHEETKKELELIKIKYNSLAADNQAYQNSLYELKTKVHLFQKQETVKTKQLEEEISELKKNYDKAMKELANHKDK